MEPPETTWRWTSKLPGRPGGGPPVNPRVAPESPVLGRQRRLDQGLGDFAILDRAMKRAITRTHHAQGLTVPIEELQLGSGAGEKRGWQRHEGKGQPA